VGAVMLSRVADSLYWAARYLERVENYARFIEVNLNLFLELPKGGQQDWEPLLIVTGDRQLFFKQYQSSQQDHVIRFLTFDQNNPNAILSSLFKARENIREIREQISTEFWEQLNTLFLEVKSFQKKKTISIEDYFDFFNTIVNRCYTLTGLAVASIERTSAWHFSQMGLYLERIDQLTRILDAKFFDIKPQSKSLSCSLDLLLWTGVLKSITAYDAYLRYHKEIHPKQVALFLIFNPDFPRSIRFGLAHAQRSLHAITGRPIGSAKFPVEKRMGKLKVSLDYLDIDEIFDYGFHQYLDKFQIRLKDLDQDIYQTFFNR